MGVSIKIPNDLDPGVVLIVTLMLIEPVPVDEPIVFPVKVPTLTSPDSTYIPSHNNSASSVMDMFFIVFPCISFTVPAAAYK